MLLFLLVTIKQHKGRVWVGKLLIQDKIIIWKGRLILLRYYFPVFLILILFLVFIDNNKELICVKIENDELFHRYLCMWSHELCCGFACHVYINQSVMELESQVAFSGNILHKFVFISCGKLCADIEDLMNDCVCYRWWTEWRKREPVMEL